MTWLSIRIASKMIRLLTCSTERKTSPIGLYSVDLEAMDRYLSVVHITGLTEIRMGLVLETNDHVGVYHIPRIQQLGDDISTD